MILEDRTEKLKGEPRHQLPAIVVSLIVHAIWMVLLALKLLAPTAEPDDDDKALVYKDKPREVARLFMPTEEEMRAVQQQPPPPARIATPPPTPAPPKDRISIGPRSDRRAEQIRLERDREISSKAKGDGAIGPGEARRPETPPPTAMPPRSASNAPLADPSRSIMGSLRQFDKKLEQGGSGLGFDKVGPQHADIAYDPHGADFSEWIDHLRRELYRNWIVPQAAIMGFKGHVTVRFVVGRDGSLLRGDISQPSGTVSLDRAAKNAVLGSRMRPLPPDYGPSEFELSVTFYYNEGPRPS